jgi:hypothetical protein
MHRQKIGLAALVLLAIALYCRVAQPQGGEYLEGASWRVGAVLGALWLAYPQLSLLPRWLLATLLAAMVVISWRPKALLIVLPVLAALALLRPRRKWTGARSQRSEVRGQRSRGGDRAG